MEETSMSMNHALSSHLLGSFDQSRRACTPAFGGHGLTAPNSSTQLGFFPLAHGNFSQMSSMSNSASADQLAEMQAKLNKKLGPEFISQRPGPGGGPKLTYAEGWKIINLANEVFGFNGWSSSVLSITTDYIDQNPETQRYNVGVSALVRVTLRDGAFHEDVGFGALENAKGKGMALDKCKKEAVTDGIKRTLRNFGNVLGNCLYDKQYVSEIAKIKAPVIKLDKDSLHRRPDLAGPVPNMPPRESTPLPSTSTTERTELTMRPTGNPSPLATSTPITSRTLGSDLPTPDTSMTTNNSKTLPNASTRSAPPQGSAPRSTTGPPSRANNPITSTTRTSVTGPAGNRIPSPVSEPSTTIQSAPAPTEDTTLAPNPFDEELAGGLRADGSVYGGSEDDAFFDNILPGELDMEVADIPAIPSRVGAPQISKQGTHNASAPLARSGSTSDSAASRSMTNQPTRTAVVANGSSDPAPTTRPSRIRLADAIRNRAPSNGSGPASGDKRTNPSDLAAQKRQRTS